MQLSKKPWVFGVLTAAILLLSLFISRSLIVTAPRAERQPPERQARLVDAVFVQPGSEQLVLTAYGVVEAAQRVSLSAQVSGVVAEIAPQFVPGARVLAGQSLLKIDPSDLLLARDRARADLATAQASLAQERGRQQVAQADLELLDMPLADSERALMLREPQRQAAQAAVDSARTRLAAAELDLARAEIRAPFDARVIRRDVVPGAQVGGVGTVLGELVGDELYWVTLMLPAASLRWLELPDEQGQGGSAVQIRDASRPDAGPWQGRVIRLLSQIETQGRRAQLLVEVNPRAPGAPPLLLGSYVKAQIQGRRLDAVYRLNPAWIQQDSVWVVREGRLHRAELELLHAQDDGVIARGELGTEARVMSSVLTGAVEGMQVRLGGESTP